MASVGLQLCSSDHGSFEGNPHHFGYNGKHIQDGLEVTETGKGLKVQTDKPHLVSLGGGRLSTAVTLMPLPPGKTTIGTVDAPLPQDIVIQGTGVEHQHCFIENVQGVVTLHPVAVMVAVDGLIIARPTRLSQGSMICLGRSNYFRFNHPQEAQLMRTVLPNTRISVVPLNFHPDAVDFHSLSPRQFEEKTCQVQSPRSPESPSSSGSRPNSIGRPHRDEMESEEFVEKVSKFEFLAHSRHSPVTSDPQRWFVRDGIRSPLSPSPCTSSLSSRPLPSNDRSGRLSDPPLSLAPTTNGNRCKPPPAPKVGPPTPPKPNTVPFNSVTNKTSPISPKFVCLTKIDPHISPKVFVPMLPPPPNEEKLRHLPGRCTPSYHKQNGSGQNCSLEDLRACQVHLEQQHQKVIEDRIREQELERQEQLRLEEILNLCAEYERQTIKERGGQPSSKAQQCNNSAVAGHEKQESANHSPQRSPNHSLHMNRIKTNGSLPRDRIVKVPPPGNAAGYFQRKPVKSTSSEDELNRIFSFDTSAHYKPVESSGPQRDHGRSCIEGKSPTSYSTYPQSPRTRIKTVVSCEKVDEIYENRLALSDYQLSIDKKETTHLPGAKQTTGKAATDRQYRIVKERFAATLPHTANMLDVRQPGSPTPPPPSPDEVFISEKSHTLPRRKDTVDVKPASTLVQEVVVLRRQKACAARRVSDIKRRAMDLDTQEEEAVRELEMERALLEGECQALLESQRKEQEKLRALKQRECDMIEGAELAREKEDENINIARLRLEAVEQELHRLESSLDMQPEGSPERDNFIRLIKHQQEVVESEKKIFEDLEFQQLEHEAHREEEREQVVREQGRLEMQCLAREMEIKELDGQKEELRLMIAKETCALQLERQKLMTDFKKEKTNISEIELKLKDLNLAYGAANQNSDTSPRSSDGEKEQATRSKPTKSPTKVNVSSKHRSAEDLIFSVTSSSPMVAKDGSLGSKALLTLKEIERNRQLILEKEGNQVIEEERRRVQELKQRAAEEVRLQWEEKQNRETNCSSFNSVESETSSATSSDLPADSISSEDYTDKLADRDFSTSSPEDEKALEIRKKMRQKEAEMKQTLEETRPLSDCSQEDIQIKYRDKQYAQQRPLTRYLPVRTDAFDLKQHVESAGHQIELCSHVHVTSTTCRGSLYKLGTKFRTWNKRWFVFDRSRRMMMYYSDKSETRPRGSIYFQYIIEVYVDHLHSVKSPNPKLTFCVKTMDRTYYLVAPSAEALRIWVDVIFTGAEGYQEFQSDS